MNKLDLTTRKGRNAFYKTSEWQILKNFILSQHPLCSWCIKKDRIEVATTVHHKRDLVDFPEGALDPENLEPLCWKCHNTHSGIEASGSLKDLSPVNRTFSIDVQEFNRKPK